MYLKIQKAYEEIQYIRGLKQKPTNIRAESHQDDFEYKSARPNQHFYKDNFDSFNQEHKDFDFKVFRKAYNREEFEGFNGRFN
jgi:hypothetical protein